MKKVLSIILSLLMIISTIPAVPFSVNAQSTCGFSIVNSSTLDTGDTFEMGMYPQSEVTDGNVIEELSKIDCELKNYGYAKNVNVEEHTYEIAEFYYSDILYNDELYRKVFFSEYRLTQTFFLSQEQIESINKNADKNCKYTRNNTYYFKWEPIEWQVLAKEEDGVYSVSKYILDSQPYNIFFEDCTWETCSLRIWLNDTFYNSAFTSEDKENINLTTLYNEDNPYYGTEGGNDTTDNIWIMSHSDSVNSNYGFSNSYLSNNGMMGQKLDITRRVSGSDYSQSQGLEVNNYNGDSHWFLRTPSELASACGVVEDGFADNNPDVCNFAGIRPAFKLKLNTEIKKFNHNYTTENTAPTCIDQGYTTYTCMECGHIYRYNYIEPEGHKFDEGVITTAANCMQEGEKE